MKRKDNVIELFPKQNSGLEKTKWEKEQEELKETVDVSHSNEKVDSSTLEPEEMEDGISSAPKADLNDWINENCNNLDVYLQEDGQKMVLIPLDVLNEMVLILQGAVYEEQVMLEALVRISQGENDIASKMARNAIDHVNQLELE
ncbi:hypothetical protein [Rossellomorea marisflavi]|uniref:hypothetical protein n=1 Tax=Rossellomorea marisflavi TaxID=189381 RepID=UPI003FA12DD4